MQRTLTKRQRQQRQEFVTYNIGLTFKNEEHPTEFESMLTRLGLSEADCHENAEMRAWISAQRNSKYVPETILRRLGIRTLFDEGKLSPYSLTDSGIVIEPVEQHDTDGETQTPQDEAAAFRCPQAS